MNQTLALAGLFQATQLVRETAWQGRVSDPAAFRATLGSILKIDADSPLDVYGGAAAVAVGLKVLLAQIADNRSRDVELTRYGATLLHLERRLARRADLLETLGRELSGMDQAGVAGLSGAGDDGATPLLVTRLASLYQRTISTLQPRVMVQGDQGYLSRTDLADQIRALLLGGIRSAVLWRQMGGGRLRLLFFRGATQRATEAWLAQLEESDRPI